MPEKIRIMIFCLFYDILNKKRQEPRGKNQEARTRDKNQEIRKFVSF